MKPLEELSEVLDIVKSLQETAGFAIPAALIIASGSVSAHYFEKGDLVTARKVIDYSAMILGGWVIQNTESEIGEAVGLGMIGIPIQNELLGYVSENYTFFIKSLLAAYSNVPVFGPFRDWLLTLF